jgi:pseudouridine-5'-phosphate glycosidase
MTDLPLRFGPGVHEALRAGAPVVALESTIITHGMPWPQNMRWHAMSRAISALPVRFLPRLR